MCARSGETLSGGKFFPRDMTSRIGVPVTPVATAEEAVRGADIVITCTTSTTPVVDGRWLERGVHINAAGVNFANKREIDSETVGARM